MFLLYASGNMIESSPFSCNQEIGRIASYLSLRAQLISLSGLNTSQHSQTWSITRSFCRITTPRPFILGGKNAFYRDNGLPYTSLYFEFYLLFLCSHQFGLQTCIPAFSLDSQTIPLFGVDPSSCSKEVIADIQKELRLLSYCTTPMDYSDHMDYKKWWETRYKELIQSTPTEEKGKQFHLYLFLSLYSASY